MKHLARVALLGLPCLLGSCTMLDGPIRTGQAAFRTFSDAGDPSSAPPTLEAADPAAVSLRLSSPRQAEIWSAPAEPAPHTHIGI
jgi:hypothetical protein